MNLSDKLDAALQGRGLQTCKAAPTEEPAKSIEPEKQVESVEFATFDTLRQLIDSANNVEPDDDGIRVVYVKNVEVEDINLPMAQGKFIIDDIQKHKSGYEVHLLENPGCKE